MVLIKSELNNPGGRNSTIVEAPYSGPPNENAYFTCASQREGAGASEHVFSGGIS